MSAPDVRGVRIPDLTEGSAPGWPVVLRFGRVRPGAGPADGGLSPDGFARALDTVLDKFEPADPCVLMADHDLIRCTRPAALFTFDHGYRDQVEYALPKLEERGINALFFVCTGALAPHPGPAGTDWLDWDTCRALRAAGHVLGSHGVTPAADPTAEPAETRRQVVGSLHDLRFHVGVRRGLYAYPGGIEVPVPHHVPLLGALLAFGMETTVARPWTDAPLAIRRTHLPAAEPGRWSAIVGGWRAQWERE
ncbi:MAG TPA: polysaccharide deacetylase family protein [Actinocrinis sp.]|nr:polysaccharide deacetylase family protein [Actinocrinis sp.]